MRFMLLTCFFILTSATAARAQDMPRADLAVNYQWVRTNATPGACGCFGLNGGGLSGSWSFHYRFALVGDISAQHTSNALSTGNSLTLTTFMAGVRYRFNPPYGHGPHAPQPFAQILLGAVHAGGNEAGTADHTYSFAARVGGGVDVPLTRHFTLRVIQLDYFLTRSQNAVNDHQNNFLLSTGVAFRWPHAR